MCIDQPIYKIVVVVVALLLSPCARRGDCHTCQNVSVADVSRVKLSIYQSIVQLRLQDVVSTIPCLKFLRCVPNDVSNKCVGFSHCIAVWGSMIVCRQIIQSTNRWLRNGQPFSDAPALVCPFADGCNANPNLDQPLGHFPVRPG